MAASWRAMFFSVAMAAAMTATTAPVQAQSAGDGAEAVARIVVRVNDKPITGLDIAQRVNLIILTEGIQPSPQVIPLLQRRALDELINEQLQLQEAQERGLELDEIDVDSQIRNIAASNGSTVEQLEYELLRSGVTPDAMRDSLRAQTAWRRLVQGVHGRNIRVSDSEIEATLNRIQASANKEQYLVSLIFLPATTEQEKEQMYMGGLQLIEEMKKGAPFPAIAQQVSAAPYAATGGDLGWIAEGDLDPSLEEIVKQLDSGQVSNPIVAQDGVYLVALRDKRESFEPEMTLTLKQILAPADSDEAKQAALRALGRAMAKADGCVGFEALADEVEGATAADLGTLEEAGLSPEYRAALEGLDAGDVSQPFLTAAGAHVVAVCDRTMIGLPSREDIENRLYDQELAMEAQRYLEGLWQSALIDPPVTPWAG